MNWWLLLYEKLQTCCNVYYYYYYQFLHIFRRGSNGHASLIEVIPVGENAICSRSPLDTDGDIIKGEGSGTVNWKHTWGEIYE